ncbi:hypothetical protein V5O48_012847 [Marasmius crinis-equi]|uniref:Brl1/Brr6 domain-containing protein n=1 Tax=Marasmius crinis-equi TaxID=585013 RepID=A0ABR3F1Y6_9AGAR
MASPSTPSSYGIIPLLRRRDNPSEDRYLDPPEGFQFTHKIEKSRTSDDSEVPLGFRPLRFSLANEHHPSASWIPDRRERNRERAAMASEGFEGVVRGLATLALAGLILGGAFILWSAGKTFVQDIEHSVQILAKGGPQWMPVPIPTHCLSSSEIELEAAACLRRYSENQCHEPRHAIEKECVAWALCKDRPNTDIDKLQLIAERLALVFNSFIDTVSYKALIVSLLGLYIVSLFIR